MKSEAHARLHENDDRGQRRAIGPAARSGDDTAPQLTPADRRLPIGATRETRVWSNDWQPRPWRSDPLPLSMQLGTLEVRPETYRLARPHR